MNIVSRFPALAAALSLFGLAPFVSVHAQAPSTPAPSGPAAGPATMATPTPAAVAPETKAAPKTEVKEGGAHPPKDRAPSKATLEKYDTNHDGTLDAGEKEAMRTQRREERLKKYDKNGDGKIDKTERVQIQVDRLRQQDAAKKTAKPADEKKP